MATVIKPSTAPQATGPVPFEFQEMCDPACATPDEARRAAAEIVAQAQRDAALIRQHAHDEGRAAALATVEQILDEKVARQLAMLLPALRAAVDSVEHTKAECLSHWEKTGVHVAAAIAGRVIRREVARTPEIALALVKEALELAAGTTDIQLHMHPDDLAVLGDRVSQLTAELVRLGRAQVVPNVAIERGGCRIETRFGSIDQQFEAQLARIEEELT